MQLTAKLLVLGLLLISTARAAEPAPAIGPEQLTSAAWWRRQAVHYADAIADADARGRTHYELSYVLARADDLDGACASILSVNNLQLRVFAIDFLARQYKKRGDEKSCRIALQQAEKGACTDFCVSRAWYAICR